MVTVRVYLSTHKVRDTTRLLWLKAAQAQIPPVFLFHSLNEVLSRSSSKGFGPSVQVYESLNQPARDRHWQCEERYCPREKTAMFSGSVAY